MAKLALQLQSVVVVLTLFLIVIDQYVSCSTSKRMGICRDDYDTFDNPTCDETGGCTNCTAMNAYCNITDHDIHSGCPNCTCFGQYKTYLRDFRKCVRDDWLLFFPVGRNTFMTEHYQRQKCITYDRSDKLKVATCNLTDPFQEWIWTRHNQLLHVDTLKCIQQEQEYSGTNYIWHLGLEECNISETKQKWNCFGYQLQKSFTKSSGQPHNVRITHENNTILAKLDVDVKWERYGSNSKICSSSSGCNGFTNPSSAILVLDVRSQRQGKQKISGLSKMRQCVVNSLQFRNYGWKHIEYTGNIFSISETKFLRWNFARAPSNWTDSFIKLNFTCNCTSRSSQCSTATTTGCVLIKLKYNPYPDYTTTASSVVPSSETVTTATPVSPGIAPTLTSSISTLSTLFPTSYTTTASSVVPSSETVTTATPVSPRTTPTTSSISTLNTSPPTSTMTTKPSTGSKEKQEGEPSNVVGITVGVLVAILVVCGIILGVFCYKRRTSRLDKTSSNVEINDKSSGDTLNPIYSSEDKNNASFSNDDGVYQEPDGNMSGASQACDLYEPGDDHEYDYAKVEQRNKPTPSLEELEYDYAKSNDIRSSVQLLPVKSNEYDKPNINDQNTSTNTNEVKETEKENDAGGLYETLEDDTGPVYQTLEE